MCCVLVKPSNSKMSIGMQSRGSPSRILTFNKTLRPSAKLSMSICFIITQFCLDESYSEIGTTPNLKHIVIGRCYNYITLVNPTLRYDCEAIWREFEEAVVRRSACDVEMKHYHPMFNIMPQIWPCDRFLFWSKTRNLMHIYAAVVHHFLTLEDTLVGYVFNDLVWCGQDDDTGFDFHSCPEWSLCNNHPVYSLWRKASQNFAEAACGNITVLLNGSINNAFNRKSMFGSVELDGLNPRMVNHVNIKVVANLEGPFIETCSRGSVVELIGILQARGFRWTCTDNDLTLMILQCVQNPKMSSCHTCSNSLSEREMNPWAKV